MEKKIKELEDRIEQLELLIDKVYEAPLTWCVARNDGSQS